ncbi:MAG: hypothetical protein ACE5OZ_11435 [Candidatus Heimdallarchaeota archaeon]
MSATEGMTISVILEVDPYAVRSQENLENIGKVLQMMSRINEPDETIHEALLTLKPRGVTRLGWNIGGEEIIVYPFVERPRSSS